MITPVILAGGVGSRLWPLSRENYPKQFIPLVDPDCSLLQSTLMRLTGINNLGSPILVCNDLHRFLVAEQIRQLNLGGARILLEPTAKNTAPALALAAFSALQDDRQATLLVLPADHLLQSTEVFHNTVAMGADQSAQGMLVTFGIHPTRPETGYGYIKSSEAGEEDSIYQVEKFVEKPDSETAKTYLEEGGYYWNSGMFMFKAETYLSELKNYAADIFEVCERAHQSLQTDLDFLRVDEDIFAQCRSESIDYAVMERTRNSVVIPLKTGWSDVGAWDALSDVSDCDEGNNTICGDVMLEDTTDSYIRSESRFVAGIGLKDLIVVETSDAVLVADRSQAQKVKNIVSRLKQEERKEVEEHTRVYRPWGSYESIVAAERFQAKRIIVNPGAALSLQLHHHRAEHWVVVKGRARVTTGEKVFDLNEDESTYIPIGAKHRLENPGKIPLEIIEVQTGSYLGEDDIVRFDDQYGREA